MLYKNYLNQIKEIQQSFVDYFDNKDDNNNDYIIQFFTDLKKDQTPQQIKETLHFISKFSNNYHRSCNFFDVFEKILEIYQDAILKNFSNRQIFRIFRHNKRILLILFEKEILKPDICIFKIFNFPDYIDKKYLNYFYPEFEKYIDEYEIKDIKRDIESFEQKRKKGENDDYLYQLIQNDSIIDFISYVNRTNYSLNSKISKSIFETNSFLLNARETSLIEYAAFFGSIQIFKYLFMNGIKLTPSLWLYSIHGKNPEIIHFLEENKIMPNSNSFKEILIESIKCHHNDFVIYIQNNLMNIQEVSDFNFHYFCRKNYNYYFFPEKLEINTDTFYDFCKFDYISIIDFIIEKNDVNLSDLNAVRMVDKKIYNGNKFFVEKISMNIEQTPFQTAIRKGNLEIVKLLFDKLKPFDINKLLVEKCKSSPKSFQKTLFSIAVQNYDLEMAKYLLENAKVDVNIYFFIDLLSINQTITPLILAIFNEDIQMVELLLNQKSIDVNKKSSSSNKTPLYYAIEVKNFEIVKSIISREDINVNELCIDDNYYSMMQYFEAPVLIKAILLGDAKLFNLLLTNDNIDKNCVFKYKKKLGDELQEKKAFYFSVELKRKEIISIFLSLPEIDVNEVNTRIFIDKKSYYKTSPFFIACDNGDPEIVQLLLKREDIDINFKSKYQSEQDKWSEYIEKSCLHHAIDKNNIEIVRILLENSKLNVNDIFLVKRKVSSNVTKMEEKTALHIAVEKNLPEIVRLLLSRKDLQIDQEYLFYKIISGKNNKIIIKTTALDMAREKNYTEIINLLSKEKKNDIKENEEIHILSNRTLVISIFLLVLLLLMKFTFRFWH